MSARAFNIHRPLCVDMDGTLLATDILWESLLMLLKKKPWSFALLPLWLLRGKAVLKHQLAQQVKLNPATLPYRDTVISYLEKEKDSGREIILATASDQQVADSIAEHLGVFSAVIASDGQTNLAGQKKCQALENYVGSQEFDYMGDGIVDIPVWRTLDRAILVHPTSRLRKRVRGISSVDELLSPQTRRFASVLKALRVHQWVKNGLIFIPLLLAHKITEISLVLNASYAFLAFSLGASSVYVINDLMDLEADRQHPQKRNRPFAAGLLQLKTGVLIAPLLFGGSLAIAAFLLPPLFSAALIFYFVVTTAYSFYLKRVLIVDVLVLAGLYTLRVLAGAAAVSVVVSPWLLTFSMFFFLSLAFIKRYAELRMMQDSQQTYANGRGYLADDTELIRSVGATSGYLSVLVLAFYINSREVVALYDHPMYLWFMGPFLLYWITRMWFLANRAEIKDDPIVFTVKDPASYVVGAVIAVVMIAASS